MSGCSSLSRRRQRHWVQVGITLLVALLGGCQESLPPREEPQVVLRGDVSLLTTTIRFNATDSSLFGSSGELIMQVENIYSDVLQDTALLQATVSMYLEDEPQAVSTVIAGYPDVINSYQVLQGQILTLGVDTSVVFEKTSQYRTPSGVPLWQGLPFTHHDLGNAHWWEAPPKTLVVDALLQAYQRLPAIHVRKEFTVIFQIR
ncbi:MAG TPA: hypothetical protein VEO56_16070 [Bacteroidota bacterium]|nr:hypothetical protein [Bacteroidota bacterium]